MGNMGALLGGCSAHTPPTGEDSAPTRAVSHALSDPGIEKRIPLRFVNLLSCTPGAGCPDNTTYANILRAVDIANDVFKSSGIQFWPKSIERYKTTHFADMSTAACGGWGFSDLAWPVVSTELKQLFPLIPETAWLPGDVKTGGWWLLAANTMYSPPDELVVWLLQNMKKLNALNVCEGYNSSHGPFTGRDIKMVGSNVTANHKLAHELGHAFGLPHPFDVFWTDAENTDPATGAQTVRSDYWDLVYNPGTSSNDYFANKADAQQHESNLERIDQKTNCQISAAPANVVTCTISCPSCNPPSEVQSTGSEAMKGLGFEFANGERGPNIMSYMDQGLTPNALSDSQIVRIRKHLRWSVQLNTTATLKVKPGLTLSAHVPLLGSWNLREVAHKLDFDYDGKRDIAIWDPPTTMGANGTFTVLLSSKGFSSSAGQFMQVSFGQLGDVPVVGDFNGDHRTDVAVFQPGGGQYRNAPDDVQGYWRWCVTLIPAEATTCSMHALTAFGERQDVPLAGLTFQTTASSVATFRPNEGKWSWRPASGGTTTTRYLGGRGSVLLPGDYDSDFLTDIAVYEPQSAYFRLLRSQQSWNSVLLRGFGTTYVPEASGSSADRSAPMPLSGMNRPQTIWTVWGYYTYPRRVFSLWDPHDGSWITMWDPLNSSAKDTCQWGLGSLDMPITGIDRSGDGYTDMVVYRGQTWDGPGYFYFKNATPGSCTGATQTVYYQYGSRVRQRVFGVADMTGDGKSDIMLVNPDTMRIQWMTSESGYTTVYSRSIGSQRSIVL